MAQPPSPPASQPASRSRAQPLFLALHFCTFVAFSAARLILPLFALSLGAEPYAVGILAGLLWLFPLFLSWPLGRLADRRGALWLLLLGSTAAVGGFLVPYFFPVMPAFYISALLFGLSIAFGNGIQQSLIGQGSTAQTRTRNFSNMTLIGASTNLVGPVIAGYAIDHSGHAAACLYLLSVPLIGGALTFAARRVFPEPRPHATAATAGESLASPDILHTLVICSVVQLGADMFQFFLPIYGHGIGLSASAIGTALGAIAVATFAIRLVLPRLVARAGEHRLLRTALALQALCFVLVPVAGGGAFLLFTCFLFGLAQGCSGPITILLMMNSAPPGRISESVGLRLTATNLMKLIGPTIFGAIGSAFGLPAVFGLNALLMVYGGVLSRPRRADAPS